VRTQLLGAANVEAVTGQPFETLVAEWQLAVYLDDLPNFTPVSDRLRYSSWGFRTIFANNCCGPDKPFDRAFPFTPTNASNLPFAQTGTLRGGSGTHFSLVLPANAPAVDILVTRQPGGAALDPALEARIAIARIR
jgi:CubicO group peptidase (beta-lactamase class C family)